MAFAKLDLDPAVDQKIAVLRLACRFPKSRAAEHDDPADALGRSLFKESDGGLDYERDVKPWIGKRVAVAAVPTAAGAKEPVEALVAVQYQDEGKARAALDKALARGSTFTVGADPTVLAVQGTAPTRGTPTALGVLEAHSQYESGGR